jgi:hypothetical protein
MTPLSRDWNESTPPGTAPANTLDTIIQHFKTDVRERVSVVIPGWANNGEDPKRVMLPGGLIAARPAGLYTGEVYFASDTQTLSLWNGTEWVDIAFSTITRPILTGTISARPAADGSGRAYFATDTEQFFVEANDTWFLISGGSGSVGATTGISTTNYTLSVSATFPDGGGPFTESIPLNVGNLPVGRTILNVNVTFGINGDSSPGGRVAVGVGSSITESSDDTTLTLTSFSRIPTIPISESLLQARVFGSSIAGGAKTLTVVFSVTHVG